MEIILSFLAFWRTQNVKRKIVKWMTLSYTIQLLTVLSVIPFYHQSCSVFYGEQTREQSFAKILTTLNIFLTVKMYEFDWFARFFKTHEKCIRNIKKKVGYSFLR